MEDSEYIALSDEVEAPVVVPEKPPFEELVKAYKAGGSAKESRGCARMVLGVFMLAASLVLAINYFGEQTRRLTHDAQNYCTQTVTRSGDSVNYSWECQPMSRAYSEEVPTEPTDTTWFVRLLAVGLFGIGLGLFVTGVDINENGVDEFKSAEAEAYRELLD